MRRAPHEFLTLLLNSCDPNKGRTTSKTGRGPLILYSVVHWRKTSSIPYSLPASYISNPYTSGGFVIPVCVTSSQVPIV